MGEEELRALLERNDVSEWRLNWARRIESSTFQMIITAFIVLNAIVLGLQTSPQWVASIGALLGWLDQLCLLVFVGELAIKLAVYRGRFWRSGWNLFDVLVLRLYRKKWPSQESH